MIRSTLNILLPHIVSAVNTGNRNTHRVLIPSLEKNSKIIFSSIFLKTIFYVPENCFDIKDA